MPLTLPIVVPAFFALLTACSSTQQAALPKSSDQDKTMSRQSELKAERELGRTMASFLLQFYGVINSPEIVDYVNNVGLYVASRSDETDRVYMFEVLNSDSINAFSSPGGYIMVTAGAIKLAENEAELAMILGHEIAHVERQHMFKTLMTKSKEKEKEKEIARSKLPQSMLARERVRATNSDLSSVTRYLTSGGIGMSVLSAVKGGIDLVTQTGLDSSYEYEADQRGLIYAMRSGYKPAAFDNYLDRLKARKAKLDLKSLDKTHPKIEDREARILDYLKKSEATDAPGAEGTVRFQNMKKKLMQLKISKDQGGV